MARFVDEQRFYPEGRPERALLDRGSAGDGDPTYAAHVRSAAFKGKTRGQQQHQMVYIAQGRMAPSSMPLPCRRACARTTRIS